MKEMLAGLFADAVNPVSMLFSAPALIVAVLLVAAGFLGYYIGKSRKGKKKEEKEEER